ncbi:type II secretion system protein GspC [Chondromyces apiculatus]|nr:type II secretion system protein GspC [Chondromyces apiculatus]
MHADLALKRAFLPAVLLLIATAAHLQAKGIAALVASALDDARHGLAPPWRRVPPVALASALTSTRTNSTDHHATTAAAILARNPFDSVTGPLDGTRPPPAPDSPDSVPTCASTRLLLVAASDDTRWSFAAIASGETTRGGSSNAVLRRTGDTVGDHVVAAIGPDRIWLEASGTRCEVKLGAPAIVSGTREPSAREPPQPSTARGGPGNASALLERLRERIRPLGEDSFEIDRSAIAMLLEQPALIGGVRPSPAPQDGGAGGLRLTGIRPGSPLAAIGLKSGDHLLQVNGADVRDPRAVLALHAQLGSTSLLTATLSRDGRPRTVTLHVR